MNTTDNAKPTNSSVKIPKRKKGKKVHIALPMSNNHVIEAFKAPAIDDEESHTWLIYGYYLNEILKDSLPEEIGCYDAGCHYDMNGAIICYSYKDPHYLETFTEFEQIISEELSEEILYLAKLSFLRRATNINKSESEIIYNSISNGFQSSYIKRVLDTQLHELVPLKEIIIEELSKDYSVKLIYGNQQNNLDGLISRGWEIKRPIEKISVKENSYDQNTNQKAKINFPKYRII